ncbi:mitochondrial carrier [Melanomma pulvis-pyrius CBS 109.77]|uniref:Mitochondrial carrier n=1 Tax=Melanomma pulvis-pyrius CBS 109.77 TaxID=1314802 RepID=A0A6A6XMG7_9PLEO|nr:mitochondrial carrier [Melanomma pulvis-pyrius CBS 109.77]
MTYFPFWFGGSAASMATLFTHPLDLIKVRLQTTSSPGRASMIGVIIYVVRNEGSRGLYAGISAALLRQMSYSTVRFGIYEHFKSRLNVAEQNTSQSHLLLIPLSAISGALGGIAGNPADIVNVRMQSDMSKPFENRRNYKHALDGILRIRRDEGIGSLFRAVSANSTRAALMNSSQLASYDMFKAFCTHTLSMPDDSRTYLAASLMAGITATTVCSPVDVVRTRMMNSATKESLWQVLQRSSLSEGPMWMLKGWLPSFIRLGPQTVLTMLFFEQHKKLYLKLKKNVNS